MEMAMSYRGRSLQPSEAVARLRTARHIAPEGDVLRFFKDALDVYRESLAIQREIARISAATEVALTQVREKHGIYREALGLIFEERREAIAKHFDIIDQGIARNDHDLMLRGLQGVGAIVAASPFANLKDLAQILEGDQPLEF